MEEVMYHVNYVLYNNASINVCRFFFGESLSKQRGDFQH